MAMNSVPNHKTLPSDERHPFPGPLVPFTLVQSFPAVDRSHFLSQTRLEVWGSVSPFLLD